jgi:hypothetical protein
MLNVALTRQFVAELSLAGMGCDVLGGCYLAYDLLGGKRGPLRTIARATGYVALFFIGYLSVLGVRYALVAASGMGILLAIEFRRAGANPELARSRGSVVLFGFLRGLVLGLAGMTIAGLWFAAAFGIFSGAGLAASYVIGFAPTHDYETRAQPRLSSRRLFASLLRAIAVSVAGILASLLTESGSHWLYVGLRLGLAAGIVSALVSLLSPAIEWRIDNLPERRLGMLGLGLILAGMILQSIQYWTVVLNMAAS